MENVPAGDSGDQRASLPTSDIRPVGNRLRLVLGAAGLFLGAAAIIAIGGTARTLAESSITTVVLLVAIPALVVGVAPVPRPRWVVELGPCDPPEDWVSAGSGGSRWLPARAQPSGFRCRLWPFVVTTLTTGAVLAASVVVALRPDEAVTRFVDMVRSALPALALGVLAAPPVIVAVAAYGVRRSRRRDGGTPVTVAEGAEERGSPAGRWISSHLDLIAAAAYMGAVMALADVLDDPLWHLLGRTAVLLFPILVGLVLVPRTRDEVLALTARMVGIDRAAHPEWPRRELVAILLPDVMGTLIVGLVSRPTQIGAALITGGVYLVVLAFLGMATGKVFRTGSHPR